MGIHDKLRSAAVAVLAVAALLLSGDQPFASAAGSSAASSQIGVGTRVNTRCILVTGPLTFPPTYIPNQAAPLDSSFNVLVDCDQGRRVNLLMDEGFYPAPGSTGRDPLRRMLNGTNYLSYNLYEDATYSTVWGTGSPGVRVPRPFPSTMTVYGRIDGGQPAAYGTYNDLVNAWLMF